MMKNTIYCIFRHYEIFLLVNLAKILWLMQICVNAEEQGLAQCLFEEEKRNNIGEMVKFVIRQSVQNCATRSKQQVRQIFEISQ